MSIKLFGILVIAGSLFAIGCGGKDVEVVYKNTPILCPESAITCSDCENITYEKTVEDFIGIKEQSLDINERMLCFERCDLLKQKAREICEEKFQNEKT